MTSASTIQLGAAETAADLLLDVKDLTVEFPTEDGVVKAVRGVSYQLKRGEALGIVGESGPASRSPRWPCSACCRGPR